MILLQDVHRFPHKWSKPLHGIPESCILVLGYYMPEEIGRSWFLHGIREGSCESHILGRGILDLVVLEGHFALQGGVTLQTVPLSRESLENFEMRSLKLRPTNSTALCKRCFLRSSCLQPQIGTPLPSELWQRASLDLEKWCFLRNPVLSSCQKFRRVCIQISVKNLITGNYVQIGQKIISSLPESLDTPEKQEVFQAFTTIYEAALWKTGSVENSTTVSPTQIQQNDQHKLEKMSGNMDAPWKSCKAHAWCWIHCLEIINLRDTIAPSISMYGLHPK